MGLLTGKTVLVTGVLTDKSIAFHVARLAQEEGAGVILTAFGRGARLTAATAARLPQPVLGLEDLDVTDQTALDSLAGRLRDYTDGLDTVVHSIGFASGRIMGGRFLEGEWEDVAVSLKTSSYSLKALAVATLPLLRPGSAIVGLTFDGRFAWPVYDWMGVSKAAFEAVARYLARDLGPRGIRVNLVAAGPVKTTAAQAIPGFEQMEGAWAQRAPLGWDSSDPVPAARAVVALASGWFPATTGEVIHVDGGVHAQG